MGLIKQLRVALMMLGAVGLAAPSLTPQDRGNRMGDINDNRGVVIQDHNGTIEYRPQSPTPIVEVVVRCRKESLPIRVPPGETARVVRLNPFGSSILTGANYVDFHNAETQIMEVPDADSDKMEILNRRYHFGEEENFYRCVFSNHGNVNIIEIEIAYQYSYTRNFTNRQSHNGAIVEGPIDVGREIVLYFAHDCPASISWSFHRGARVRYAGAQNITMAPVTTIGESRYYLGESSEKWLDHQLCPSA